MGSPVDISTYAKYSSPIGFSFNENGLFLVLNIKYKSNKNNFDDIYIKMKDVRQTMIDEFHESEFDKVDDAIKLKHKNESLYNEQLHAYVINNHNRYVKMYKQTLRKYGIKVIFINNGGQ